LARGAVHLPVVAVSLLHLRPAQPTLLIRTIHAVLDAIANRCAGYARTVAAAECITRTPDLLTHGDRLIGAIQAVGAPIAQLVQLDTVASSTAMPAACGILGSQANGDG